MKNEDNCVRCDISFGEGGFRSEEDKNICTTCINPSTSSRRTINLPISTTNEIPLQKIVKYVGLVRGGTVRAKHVGTDFLAGLKNVVGGEIKGYTSLLAEAREEAIHRMEEDAVRIGANGIIGMTFSTSMIDVGAAEVYAFGTGVILDSTETE
tara:strand:+ start:158 stop:616 length:459 start_codon:yes stop_codon:yes gene_type:complete